MFSVNYSLFFEVSLYFPAKRKKAIPSIDPDIGKRKLISLNPTPQDIKKRPKKTNNIGIRVESLINISLLYVR